MTAVRAKPRVRTGLLGMSALVLMVTALDASAVTGNQSMRFGPADADIVQGFLAAYRTPDRKETWPVVATPLDWGAGTFYRLPDEVHEGVTPLRQFLFVQTGTDGLFYVEESRLDGNWTAYGPLPLKVQRLKCEKVDDTFLVTRIENPDGSLTYGFVGECVNQSDGSRPPW